VAPPGEKNLLFTVYRFLAENFATNIKAVHNLKTKSLCIILTFVPFS